MRRRARLDRHGYLEHALRRGWQEGRHGEACQGRAVASMGNGGGGRVRRWLSVLRRGFLRHVRDPARRRRAHMTWYSRPMHDLPLRRIAVVGGGLAGLEVAVAAAE